MNTKQDGKQDRQVLYAALVRTARPIILESFSQRSCVASARVAVSVLRSFGVPARGMVTQAIVANEAANAQLIAGCGFEQLSAATGAWTVGLGYCLDDAMMGHVVALDDVCLIDLAIDEANDEAHGLELVPHIFPVTTDERRSRVTKTVVNLFGAGVIYRLLPTDGRYKRAPDWQKRDLIKHVTKEISAAMWALMPEIAVELSREETP